MSTPVGMSDIYPAQQILYTLSVLAILIPAPAHIKGGNTGVIILIVWFSTCMLLLLIHSIVWRGNIRNPAPVYCDIATAIIAIAPLGCECGVLCITRRLHKITRSNATLIGQEEGRRDRIIDLCIGIGIPILLGVGHGLVQGHRFDIFEDVGCYPTVYNVTLAYPLYWMWWVIIPLISGVYGTLAIIAFFKQRKQFKHLNTVHNRLRSQYLRLMWLCSVDILFSVPFFTYDTIDHILEGVDPWVSWEVTQYDWYRVQYVDRFTIDINPKTRFKFILYMCFQVTLAFIFFLLFGFTPATRQFYKDLYCRALRRLGIETLHKSDGQGAHEKGRRMGYVSRLFGRGTQRTVTDSERSKTLVHPSTRGGVPVGPRKEDYSVLDIKLPSETEASQPTTPNDQLDSSIGYTAAVMDMLEEHREHRRGEVNV